MSAQGWVTLYPFFSLFLETQYGIMKGVGINLLPTQLCDYGKLLNLSDA